nr:Fc receptor-like protein 6 [Meriones unguiculatus]
MLLWMVLLFLVSKTEAQESLQTPVLSRIPSPDSEDLILKCKSKVYPEKPALQLFYSFYKDSRVIQNRSHSPIFSITEAKDEDSGLYQCMVATKDGIIQKRSNHLEIQLQMPVSHPVLSLEHEATNPAVGDVVKFLCEAERGSLPIVYSFYLDGKILGEPLTPPGRAASLVLSVKEEWSAKNYSCEAKNNVSSERSEPKKFPSVVTSSFSGSHVLSALTNRNMLITWLPVSLLGGMIVAAVFLIYFFRAHKKDG